MFPKKQDGGHILFEGAILVFADVTKENDKMYR
jgi:hypothetical protein